ncbi:MAG: hypothetical protein K5675_02640 [Lachnospiraceae bacterium]|nr:hypothetical protein [Lachnospiraceae bacterium]
MWENLPQTGKNEYKRLILAFSSLTDMFAQKASDIDQKVAPIINSKFQETAFQRAFNAAAEDIGNTSYDVSVEHEGKKYLVGIKTFGISSGDQKVAQFKAKHDEWADLIDQIKSNAGNVESKEEIDSINQDLYLELANKIAQIRNERIDSSYANIRGFRIDIHDIDVHSVYHVLMPSDKNDEEPKIFVGETSYDKIDMDNIQVLGCTGKNNPTNFFFTDGNHTYKYTSADSQLHMNFTNRDIICDEWKVKYAKDAYAIFEKIADMVYPELNDSNSDPAVNNSFDYRVSLLPQKKIEESVCWTIWNKDGDTELYSGFNSFYGTGSKMGKEQRIQRINRIYENYVEQVDLGKLNELRDGLTTFLLESASSSTEKAMKTRLRNYIVGIANSIGNQELKCDVTKVLYRPMDEMYIPIPDSAQFHREHPNFFGPGYGELITGTSKLKLPKEQRIFNLVFDPSGDAMPAYITQDFGKAIESAEKQSYLGEWILRGVFQLGEYEPLTSQRLIELNINGLRLLKYKDSQDVHLEFIWIDEYNPPKGYIQRA